MNLRSISTRDYSLDNIRFFLILSVVFAHLLEVCTPFRGSVWIYKLIYSFHMPAFIFLFGYNGRYSPRRILFRWCIPYGIFQCAYIWFSGYVLHTPLELQFTTPYWLLWYMLACIYYQLLIPVFDTDDRRRQIITIVCAFTISFFIGFEETVGYYMSLSRFTVFLPWFLLGYYCKKNDLIIKLSAGPKKRFSILAGAGVVFGAPACWIGDIPDELFYGSYAYAACEGALWMRMMASVMAFSAILVLCVGIRPYLHRKIPFITAMGQNTWPVFLLHGFAVKAAPLYFAHLISSPGRVVLLACALVILAGNQWCSRAVDYATFAWLEKWPHKTVHRDKIEEEIV